MFLFGSNVSLSLPSNTPFNSTDCALLLNPCLPYLVLYHPHFPPSLPPSLPPYSPIMNVCTVVNTAASTNADVLCYKQRSSLRISNDSFPPPPPPPPPHTHTPVTHHVIMDMLTRRHSPLDYSPETAHTIEVSREEDENGKFGSFGFTLLNEKPPNVGTIVPGMVIGEVIRGCKEVVKFCCLGSWM